MFKVAQLNTPFLGTEVEVDRKERKLKPPRVQVPGKKGLANLRIRRESLKALTHRPITKLSQVHPEMERNNLLCTQIPGALKKKGGKKPVQ